MGHFFLSSLRAEADIVEWLAVSQSQAVRCMKEGFLFLGKAGSPWPYRCLPFALMETWKCWASKWQNSFSKPKDWLKQSFYSSWVYTVSLKPKSWKHSLWLKGSAAMAESTLLLSGWSRYCWCSDLILQLSPCCSCMPVGLVWCAFSGQVCGFCSSGDGPDGEWGSASGWMTVRWS